MSCFSGKMKEYSSISIDRFDGDNLKSTVFFLSHCHEDHMQGLSSANFLYRLQSSSDIFLYCSAVSRVLLLSQPKFKDLEKYIKILPIEVAVPVDIPEGASGKVRCQVNVTLLPAAHMPGSVMCLFEGEEGTALYTGDFRIERGGASRLLPLHYGDRVKEVKSLYIDTTFCIPHAFHIPSRLESIHKVVTLVREWISQSPSHMIVIRVRAQYGYEAVFEELSQTFGQKVHVSRFKYLVYQQLPQVAPHVTDDPSHTQIHSCPWQVSRTKRSPLPCCYKPKDVGHVKVRTITLSTMWFTQRVDQEDISARKGEWHRVCFSFHSSYSEIKDFVSYLHPKKAYPNVQPSKEETLAQVQVRLNQFAQLLHSNSVVCMATPNRPLGQQYQSTRTKLATPNNSECGDSAELDFGDDWPPKQQHKRNLFTATNKNETDQDQTKEEGGIGDEDTKTTAEKNHGSGEEKLPIIQQTTGEEAIGEELVKSPTSVKNNTDIKETSNDIVDTTSPEVMSCPGSDITDSQKTNTTIRESSPDVFADEKDEELSQLRLSFTPIKGGSYGSYMSYISDDSDVEDITDPDDEEEDDGDLAYLETIIKRLSQERNESSASETSEQQSQLSNSADAAGANTAETASSDPTQVIDKSIGPVGDMAEAQTEINSEQCQLQTVENRNKSSNEIQTEDQCSEDANKLTESALNGQTKVDTSNNSVLEKNNQRVTSMEESVIAKDSVTDVSNTALPNDDSIETQKVKIVLITDVQKKEKVSKESVSSDTSDKQQGVELSDSQRTIDPMLDETSLERKFNKGESAVSNDIDNSDDDNGIANKNQAQRSAQHRGSMASQDSCVIVLDDNDDDDNDGNLTGEVMEDLLPSDHDYHDNSEENNGEPHVITIGSSDEESDFSYSDVDGSLSGSDITVDMNNIDQMISSELEPNSSIISTDVSSMELSSSLPGDGSSPIKGRGYMCEARSKSLYDTSGNGKDVIVIDDDSSDEDNETHGHKNYKRKFSHAFEELANEPEVLDVLLKGEDLNSEKNDIEHVEVLNPPENVAPCKNGRLYVAMKPSSLKNGVQNKSENTVEAEKSENTIEMEKSENTIEIEKNEAVNDK